MSAQREARMVRTVETCGCGAKFISTAHVSWCALELRGFREAHARCRAPRTTDSTPSEDTP